MALSREVALQQEKCALLVVDMQNYCAIPGRGYHSHIDPNNILPEQNYVFDRINKTSIPAIQKLLAAFRASKSEVIYTHIESLTSDGRDQSLDYKISGLFVPKGSPDARMIEQLAPVGDEILIPKTSCSVFCSTNIEYVLRNLGITQLVVVGMVTNQCVESAVRDAADKGFLVTLVEEGCAANSPQEHASALHNMSGFARMCTATEVVVELCAFKVLSACSLCACQSAHSAMTTLGLYNSPNYATSSVIFLPPGFAHPPPKADYREEEVFIGVMAISRL